MVHDTQPLVRQGLSLNKSKLVRVSVILLAIIPLLTAFQNCGGPIGGGMKSAASLAVQVPLNVTSDAALLSQQTTQNFSIEAMSNAHLVNSFECRLDTELEQACISPFALTNLLEGAHLLKVIALDKSGKRLSQFEYAFVVDLTPPLPKINTAPSLSGATDYNLSFSATDAVTSTITYECFLDAASRGPCTSPIALTALANGQHTFGIIATDVAGNSSTLLTHSWKISLNAPEISPATPPAFSNATITINFVASSKDGLAVTSTCALNADPAAACTSSFRATNLKAGAQKLLITTTDELKRTAKTTVEWIADLAPPVVTIMAQPPAFIGASGYPVNFTSTDALGSGVASCECFIDNTMPVTCESPALAAYTKDGPAVFNVACIDKAGNRSTPSKLNLVFDGTPPRIALSATYPTINGTIVTFKFDLTDNSNGAIDLYTSYDGGAPVKNPNPFTLNNVTPGRHTLTAVARDIAGNVSLDLTHTWPKPALSLGMFHTCAAKDGALKCWGDNSNGQLGDGTTIKKNTPTNIIGTGVTDVSGAGFHTCAIVNGALQCWGNNAFGQLGDATNLGKISPVGIINAGVTAVSTADYNTCAIIGGALKCWGQNSYGQLGDGTKENKNIPTTIIAANVSAVASGTNHTCAVVAGALQCWGANTLGQLGDGTTDEKLAPVTIIAAGVTAVATETYSTCAIVTAALKCWGNFAFATATPKTIISAGVTAISGSMGHFCAIVNGALQCWGNNSNGQLGDGTTTTANTPKTIIASSVTGVSTGLYQTCAVASDILKCWGNNAYGQLGLGTYGNKNTPTTIIATGATSVSAGSNHTCSIETDALKCWGGAGMVGDGTANPSQIPTAIINSGVSKVAAGPNHSCAIVNGELKCWGQMYSSSFVFNPNINRNAPYSVINAGVIDVAIGTQHTCAIVSGALQCWGGNFFGQIGDGTTTMKSNPLTVISSGVTSVSTGSDHTCAIVNGGLQCWGSNTYKQLGDGTNVSKSTPTTIFASGVTAVSAGFYHTCAIVNGALQCWGQSNSGQIGVVSANRFGSDPVVVISTGATSVSAGTDHTCAVVSGGLQCWGSNYSGQLGLGAIYEQRTPTAVIGSGVTSVASGARHTCATLSNGALQCWGNNISGQLGDGLAWKDTPQTVLSY